RGSRLSRFVVSCNCCLKASTCIRNLVNGGDRLSHCSSIFAAACVSLFLLAIFLRHQDQSEQRLVVNLAASSSTRKGLSSGYDSPPYSGETSSSGAPRFVPEWPDVFNPTP